MHGLIFETSIWLLAGSTRLLSFLPLWNRAKSRSRHTQLSARALHRHLTLKLPMLPKKKQGSFIEKVSYETILKIFRDTSQRAVSCSVKRATSPLFDIPELFHLLFDTPLAASAFKAWLRIIKLIVKTFGQQVELRSRLERPVRDLITGQLPVPTQILNKFSTISSQIEVQ